MRCFYAASVQKVAVLILILMMWPRTAFANEIIADIGYTDALTTHVKMHVKNNLFISAKNGFGIAYAAKHKEFIGMVEYNEHKDLTLYAAFKPKTILYQVGVGFTKGHVEDALEIEYTYFVTRHTGLVVKYHTRDKFFIGFRKWL